MNSVWKQYRDSIPNKKLSMKQTPNPKLRILVVCVLCFMLLSVFSANLIIFISTTSGNAENNEAPETYTDSMAKTWATSRGSARFEDTDNFTENATLLIGMGPTMVGGNLSGYGATGDDFVDYYTIYLDNYAISGANAHKLFLDFNSTSTFNLTLSLLDPELHLLARTTTGLGFPNGTIDVVAQSTGMHFIKIELNPWDVWVEYNFTYEITNVINNRLDNNNDFSNATNIDLIITDMGDWEKKEYDTESDLLLTQPYLNQTYDLHDFYSVNLNSSENISITFTLPLGSIYCIELFNGSNTSRRLKFAEFDWNATNKTFYFDINYTGQYFFRVFSLYDDPYKFGGAGDYEFYMLVKPQNEDPVVRPGAISTITMYEDELPRNILLNDTIFYDADVGITNDQLGFYILNGTTWDTSYLSDNLSVNVALDGNTTISVLPDINTTGELLTFKAEDWLERNITHSINVIVTPVNDGPIIKSVNNRTVTSHYMDLTNNHTGYFGAREDQQFTLTVNASDNEGAELEFIHKSSKTFFASVGYNNPNIRNYTFTPDNTMVGIVQINVSINESYYYSIPGDWVVVNITVNNTNDEPLVTKVNDAFYSEGSKVQFIGKKGVFVGETISFKISAVDVDIPHGDTLIFNIAEPKPKGTIEITELTGSTLITEKEANISYTPDPFDEGIQELNVTVSDSESVVSYIILVVEVKDARDQYSLTENNCTFDYDELGYEDDFAFYELVYERPETQITYNMIAYTRRGNEPGVDIVSLFSRKVGDYMNISINILSEINDELVIRLYFVRKTFNEPMMAIDVDELPDEPYKPAMSEYLLVLNYTGATTEMPQDIPEPIIVGNNILKFSIHLGILENDYGIKFGVEFGLFAQAFKKIEGGEELNYFAYDSIGHGAAAAPTQTKSNLLTHTECKFEEKDVADDVYGYSLKFPTPDHSSGAKLISTARGDYPEIDILKLTGERVNFYFEVTIYLGTKVSNNSQVRYSVYITKPNHTESGIHLEPNKMTDTNYPTPYTPNKDSYFQLAEYNNGTTILADRTVIDNNKLTFGFHLVRLQHRDLVNLTSGTGFGIFATAVRETSTGSVLEYSFYYDTAGFGAEDSPTLILEPVDENGEEDEDKGFLYILGHFGGVPILLLIIILIIVICIIAGYAAYIKSKYGGTEDIDVPPVPPVPSARGSRAPDYGVYPGRPRDERYYDALYKEEYEPVFDAGAPAPGAAYQPSYQYGYDVIPDEEMGPVEGEEPAGVSTILPGDLPPTEPELEMPEVELPPEEEEFPGEELEEEAPAEELTEEEMGLLVSPDELISEELEQEVPEEGMVEGELEEEQEPGEEAEIGDEEEVIEEEFELEEEEDEEPVEEEEPVDEDEPVEGDEPVEDEEPVSEEEPMEEEAPEEETEGEEEEFEVELDDSSEPEEMAEESASDDAESAEEEYEEEFEEEVESEETKEDEKE